MVDIIAPRTARFAIPYDDGSGDRVAVIYDETSEYRRGYVVIEAVEDVRIDLAHVDWLIDALRSVQRIRDCRPTPEAGGA